MNESKISDPLIIIKIQSANRTDSSSDKTAMSENLETFEEERIVAPFVIL